MPVIDQSSIQEDSAFARLRQLLLKWAALRSRPVLLFRSGEIDGEAVSCVYRALKDRRLPELDVVLESLGGDLHKAFKVAEIIRRHAKSVAGVVPRIAKSGTTLVAISLDELIFGELGEMGPLDSQRTLRSDRHWPRQQSSLQIVKAIYEARSAALDLWNVSAKLMLTYGLTVRGAYDAASQFVGQVADITYTKLDLTELGDSLRSLDTAKQYAITLLKRHRQMSHADAQAVAKRLVESYASHGYVIDVSELTDIGLNGRWSNAQENTVLPEIQGALEEIEETERWDEPIQFIQLFEVPQVSVAEEIPGEQAATAPARMPEKVKAPGDLVRHIKGDGEDEKEEAAMLGDTRSRQ